MRGQEKQQGYVAVVVAIVLVLFLGFTALSVDVGMLYSARAAAQKAADAAALAGAYIFITRTDLSETTSPKLSDVIKANAVSTAAANQVFGDAVTISTSDVTVDVANRRVTVQVDRTQPTLFARALGENTANIHATAVAEASNTGAATGSGCTKPWFIPNTALDPTVPICDEVKNGNTTQGSCSLGHVLVNTSTHQPTAWGLGLIGSSFTIKPGNPQNAIAPGQFAGIDLGDSQGGRDYETNIASCPAQAIYCATSYPSENGNMVGPTAHGTCRFICYDGSQTCNNCQKDTFVSVGRYQRPDGTITSSSRSLALAPIIDVCGYCPNLPSGSVNYTVVGFALIFIDGISNGNDVNAHLISITSCPPSGGGGGGINPQETGPFALPVRLVRTS
jgi:Flp pilus assembly protein TadG